MNKPALPPRPTNPKLIPLWVDTDSGTWGDPNTIMIVQVPEGAAYEMFADGWTDSERINYAIANGRHIQ